MPAGRPVGSEKEKPFREALRLEIAALGEDSPKALRGLARNLLKMAAGKGGLPAIKEIADRLDGKPMQATEVTGKDGAPIEMVTMTTADRARALAAFVAKTKVQK
jgi:hypothetical protein